jgi:hypothetical protein
MHTTLRALLEGLSDVVVKPDTPTHTHENNITYTQHVCIPLQYQSYADHGMDTNGIHTMVWIQMVCNGMHTISIPWYPYHSNTIGCIPLKYHVMNTNGMQWYA